MVYWENFIHLFSRTQAKLLVAVVALECGGISEGGGGGIVEGGGSVCEEERNLETRL